MPVEVFVHGALCVAYSGQCLTSEALGGRSANRGQCAQACRLPYDLIVDGSVRDLGDKAYLLSPQDLAAYDLVDDLAELGVCQLQDRRPAQERPLRRRDHADLPRRDRRRRRRTDRSACRDSRKLDLAQSFSRGFTHGFLDGVNHQELVHAPLPQEPRRAHRAASSARRAAASSSRRAATSTGFTAGTLARRRRRRLRRGPPGAGRARRPRLRRSRETPAGAGELGAGRGS